MDGANPSFDIDVREHPSPPQPNETKPEPPPGPGCDPNYSGACVPVYPPDVNCNGFENVRVIGEDVHGLDRDNDGIGCETNALVLENITLSAPGTDSIGMSWGTCRSSS